MYESNAHRLKMSQLRYLVAVAECGNFSEAALQLGLSQSSISHAIATLEEELGVILLARGRHGATLTPVGERIVSKARQMLALLTDITEEANREKGLQGGKVRIAAFRSVATHILPQIIAQFCDRLPQVQVTISEFAELGELTQALRQGHADIGFADTRVGEEFTCWELLRDDYVVLLPPNSPCSDSRLSWAHLAEFPLIISANDSCSAIINAGLKLCPHFDKLNIAYTIREDSTMLSMVKQGLGAAILPRLAAEPIPFGIKVCQFPTTLERTIGVITLKDNLQTPAVFAFLDAIKQEGQFLTQVSA